MHASLVLLLALAGCVGGDSVKGSDGLTTEIMADEDGDGYTPDQGDCDDADPLVHPGRDEVCDGIDNDCSGTIDDGVGDTYYRDSDGDGYGDPGTSAVSCEAPYGYVSDATDCDDGDAEIAPGVAELCDGVDQDCDGVVDNDAPPQTWYADTDGDGYGDPAVSVSSCANPGGGTLDASDCDDGNAAIHPGADETDCADPTDYNCDGSTGYSDADGDGFAACEECDDAVAAIHPGAEETCDGVDQDCDGSVDEDPSSPVWYTDGDGDGFGDAASTVVACDQPDGTAATAGDCDDHSATVNPDAPEACDGLDDDCDGLVDEDGGSTWYLDADADGYGDDSMGVTACDAPTGYVATAGDCDDADPAFHPGADESDCSDPTDYNCDGATGPGDNDGDGYGACEECDDTSAAVNPSATESCDGIDDDCDGEIDEAGATGELTWYADADADGYGTDATTASACTAPSGYVATADDCDDSLATTHPDAAETCDGADQDCDGTIDEDATDAPTWYADADGDGYGDPGVVIAACSAPAGYVANADDCDDASAAVSPAATETCDGIDEDCDGAIDEDAPDAPVWYADADGDGTGDPATGVAACTAPAGTLADASDCDDADAAIHPDAIENCDGVDDDCDGTIDLGAADASSWYADTDADGYGDAAVVTEACSQPEGTVADTSDCDDTSADVHPGATETCDGIDDDCDGFTDVFAVGEPTWYADTDGDGFGDAGATLSSCTMPAGFVADATDCDDGIASVHPGASETCDGVDQDCDGTVDDAATDAPTWYADTDADGYGSDVATASCSAPAGYVADTSDCDDAAGSVHPGATESCNGVDDDCDGTADDDALDARVWYADADGDSYGTVDVRTAACTAPAGYVGNILDCDDGSAAVHPGASETCDGIDDDCDGSTDGADAIDLTSWYADTDSDGYGDASVGTSACSALVGYVSSSTDCDDAAASVHPGATESCNGLDDDCDGTADDAATDASTWYADADGDGYGSTTVTTAACSAPSGYVATATDCNDGSAAIHPGASELCDGIDQDCNGTIDDGATGGVVYYRDADGDGYGTEDVAETACGAPSGYVSNADDCDDDAAAINPGATEVCDDGIDEDCDGDLDQCNDSGAHALTSAYHEWDGTIANDYVGTAVAGGGDLNGDGYDDIVIGSNGYDSSSSLLNMGRTYVFYGPIASTDTLATADATLTGAKSSGDNSGTALAMVGDTDGDGKDDLLVGAYLVNGAATDSGAAYLIRGPASTTSMTLTSGVTTAFVGSAGTDYVGYAVGGAGDVNDDGRADMLIGGYQVDNGSTTDAGLVGLYYGGGTSASETLTGADVTFYGNVASQNVGFSVNGAGDVDGDGYDDFLIGSPYDDTAASNAGAVWLVYGPPSASALTPATADATIQGASSGDQLGYALAGLGDTNGDGLDDFAIGADKNDSSASDAGSVYVFTAGPSGTVSATSAGAALRGDSGGDMAGHDVAGAGDVNDDGTPDMIVGVYGYDGAGSSNTGGIYVVYGPFTTGLLSSAGAVWYGAASDAGSTSANANASLSAAGDMDGDGIDDVLYGATDADPGGFSRAGSAWLILGSGI